VTQGRAPAWLTAERVVLYGGLLAALYAAILFAGILGAEAGPPRADFLAFQAAAQLAQAGDAAAAYDDGRLQQVQAAILGVPAETLDGYLGWLSPPHFLFLVLPAAMLPYAWAWVLWIILSVAALAFGLRAVLPGLPALVAVLCLPAVPLSLSVGQTGLLVAALLATTLGSMDRRPLLAGIALGVLTVKPQFGLLFPMVLVLTGRWRVVGAAAATALLAGAASVLAFGPEPWPAFLAQIGGGTERFLAAPSSVLPRIQSVHAFLLHATGRHGLAAAVHGILALTVVAVVLRIWLRRPEGPEEARAAALLAGAFLVTPYAWTYDMPALGVAALFLVRAGLRDGFLRGEQAWLLAAVLLPVLTLLKPVSLLGPVAWLVVLGLAWRRDRAWRRSGAFSPVPSATAS
jgi:hypothetical protein